MVAALAAASLLTTSVPFAQAQEERAGQSVGVARLTPEVRASITKGLEYLAKDGVQNPNGSWGSSSNPVAETSVGFMAFMLKGYVPGRGRYGRIMDKAISYLITKGREPHLIREGLVNRTSRGRCATRKAGELYGDHAEQPSFV